MGAHTDSPVLKVKPVSKIKGSGYMQLGVECYGGGLWHTWLDRDLSLAGMLVVAKDGGGYERKLVHIKRPLLRIPSLCIHLQTAVSICRDSRPVGALCCRPRRLILTPEFIRRSERSWS